MSLTIEPLEMEQLHPRPSAQAVRSQHHHHQIPGKCRTGCMLLKMYMEVYPLVFALVFFSMLLLSILVLVENIMPSHRHRHELSHDYSNIDSHYNFRAAQIDHWCLFGGDDQCSCEDFTEPVAREYMKGWLDAHEANKVLAYNGRGKDYDVVFLGDETTEIWNGRILNLPVSLNPNGKVISDFFQKTFDGVALGISGDSVGTIVI
jgi:hypothetical protein